MRTLHLLACLAGGFAILHSGAGDAADRRDPSDPNVPVPRIRYHSVMSGYEHTPIPGTPGSWRELNERMERIGGPAGQFGDRDEPIQSNDDQD